MITFTNVEEFKENLPEFLYNFIKEYESLDCIRLKESMLSIKSIEDVINATADRCNVFSVEAYADSSEPSEAYDYFLRFRYYIYITYANYNEDIIYVDVEYDVDNLNVTLALEKECTNEHDCNIFQKD